MVKCGNEISALLTTPPRGPPSSDKRQKPVQYSVTDFVEARYFNIKYYRCSCRLTKNRRGCIKVGFKGVYITRTCFPDVKHLLTVSIWLSNAETADLIG